MNQNNLDFQSTFLKNTPSSPIIQEYIGKHESFKLYSSEIEIENNKISLDVLIKNEVAYITFSSYDEFNQPDFTTLLGFEKPIKAFNTIVDSLIMMVGNIKESDIYYSIEINDKKRLNLYTRTLKRYGLKLVKNAEEKNNYYIENL